MPSISALAEKERISQCRRCALKSLLLDSKGVSESEKGKCFSTGFLTFCPRKCASFRFDGRTQEAGGGDQYLFPAKYF